MATLLVHAAAPLVALTACEAPPGQRRRLAVAAAACACWPDLDLVTYAFERRPPELISHGGVTHSLLAAAVAALVVALAAFRALRVGSRAWRRVAWVLFAAGASHPLLDAVTAGDPGVALFAPFSAARVASPWKLLPSVQVGLDEYLGFWGILTLANELLYVIVPIGLAVAFVERGGDRRRAARLAGVWAFAVVALRLALPAWFAPFVPRAIAAMGTKDAGDPADLPRDVLPSGRLVTRWSELRSEGLFDRELSPARAPWSSSFFPSWFGCEAGRWSEPKPRLVWRTLAGFEPPSASEAKDWLARAARGDAGAEQRLFTLAPAEKVDLVLGRYDFPAQRQALGHSHNGHPRYWSGRCNGVANAALEVPEPFRVVEVTGVDGARVRFHPNDVKSLLAVAYYETRETRWIGAWCETVSFDAGATCSMSPGVLVLAATNLLGRARRSFVIDALPTIAKQYYAVARARIRVVREPYAPGLAPIAPELAGRVASLVDVAIDLDLSSTTLSYARADVREDATRYAAVGLVPVTMRYAATLALGEDTAILGGRWTGDPPDGPDAIVIADGGPSLVGGGRLAAADEIPWPLVRELARASADGASPAPAIDLRSCEACR